MKSTAFGILLGLIVCSTGKAQSFSKMILRAFNRLKVYGKWKAAGVHYTKSGICYHPGILPEKAISLEIQIQ